MCSSELKKMCLQHLVLSNLLRGRLTCRCYIHIWEVHRDRSMSVIRAWYCKKVFALSSKILIEIFSTFKRFTVYYFRM